MSDEPRLGEKEPLSTEEHEQAITERFGGQKVCTTSGKPLTDDHREINPLTGQQKDYIVLCPDERAKGFIRPVRTTYLHKICGTTTTMGQALAETYARNPSFYSGTFCFNCRAHLPLTEFTWLDDGTQVGS